MSLANGSNSMATVCAAARLRFLVETDWLERELQAGRANLRLVDMRGSVDTQTDEHGVQSAEYRDAKEEYGAGHIPGAVYLDWTRDIVDETDPVPVQLAPMNKFRRVMEEAGIGDESLVVAYDAHPASQFATRLWWALSYYGHTNVRVLNGGWAKWVREARPISTQTPACSPSLFTPIVRTALRVSATDVARNVGSGAATLVDARDLDQYTGKVRRGVRGGHIPGAISIPREQFFSPDGTFLQTEELLAAIEKIAVTRDHQVIAYCNGGVAATSVLFALKMAGYAHLANYDGSWNEWNQRFDLPVEQ